MLSTYAGSSGTGSGPGTNNVSVSVHESGDGGQGPLASPTSSMSSFTTRNIFLAGDTVNKYQASRCASKTTIYKSRGL